MLGFQTLLSDPPPTMNKLSNQEPKRRKDINSNKYKTCHQPKIKLSHKHFTKSQANPNNPQEDGIRYEIQSSYQIKWVLKQDQIIKMPQ